MNDPISYNATWIGLYTKIPSYIPKHEGRDGDNPINYDARTFHSWFSSNSIIDIIMKRKILLCALTGVAMLWYIDLKYVSYFSFTTIAIELLTHFQL